MNRQKEPRNRQMPGDERIDRSAQGDHKEKQDEHDGDQGDDDNDNEHDPEEFERAGIWRIGKGSLPSR